MSFYTDPDDVDPDVLFEAGPRDENAAIDTAFRQLRVVTDAPVGLFVKESLTL